ncbi:ZIP zinc transporter-domain-containing protein [Limtongia smithiae]|uniref:ZIP zinc transporter-domain-containing protein n=1 Tax=Limtongia smithiae TaxID=1125753 RepID=UPI0034CF56C6
MLDYLVWCMVVPARYSRDTSNRELPPWRSISPIVLEIALYIPCHGRQDAVHKRSIRHLAFTYSGATMAGSTWWEQYDPNVITVNSTDVDDAWKLCVIEGVYFGANEYSGGMGARISSVFVILFVSTFFTMFPLIAREIPSLRIPVMAYQIARNFGTGVIVATAFIHLMDPAYSEIGPNTCVGSTGNWAIYSWAPALILASVMFIFVMDLFSDLYVRKKYHVSAHESDHIMSAITKTKDKNCVGLILGDESGCCDTEIAVASSVASNTSKRAMQNHYIEHTEELNEVESSYHSQIGAFLILEFGILFHSVMIGLNLGACGDEFKTLYPVLVFHQSFEGLGIGARLSAIEFPTEKRAYPWLLCLAYGLTTPISVAIGLGVRTTYFSNSFAANIVQGVLDSISAGILIYTGLVELLARDFLFNPHRTTDMKQLMLYLFSTLLGAGIMALLGKWA